MSVCKCWQGASRQPSQLLSCLTAKSWLKRCAKELIKSRISLKIWSMFYVCFAGCAYDWQLRSEFCPRRLTDHGSDLA